jgi:hypothetical protein
MEREMPDPIDQVLKLVAEGRLTADEAGPVLDALQAADHMGHESGDDAATSAGPTPGTTPGATPRALRIEVSEGGRRVVNLRVPLAIGRMAIDHVPGLSSDNIVRIREALDQGMTGPILVVDEGGDGDGVRIVLE